MQMLFLLICFVASIVDVQSDSFVAQNRRYYQITSPDPFIPPPRTLLHDNCHWRLLPFIPSINEPRHEFMHEGSCMKHDRYVKERRLNSSLRQRILVRGGSNHNDHNKIHHDTVINGKHQHISASATVGETTKKVVYQSSKVLGDPDATNDESPIQSPAKNKLREALFPIYGRNVTKFFLMGAIKFFIIMVLTLTRDMKDTMVVTQCGAEAIAFLKVRISQLKFSQSK